MIAPVLLAAALSGALAADSVPVLDPATVDWTPIGVETAELLSAYLQVDTINPPGHELRGARFLAEWLATQGIESTIDEYVPGRANLWARVEGTSDAPPICLLSHIDVVPAEEDRWTHPSMSGHIDADGVVWGRGALDMKGMGAIEAMTLALVRRLPVPLERDVVLLAVADEEVDNTGIRAAIDRWDEIGCSHVVNEGGMGLDSLLFDGQVMFPISVGEKGFLWGEVVATGKPGHGSVPVAETAPERLVRAYIAIAERKVKPTWDPAMLELLHNVGEHKGGMAGFVLKRPVLVKTLLRGQLMGDPIIRATLIDTANLTGFDGALEPNVVPATVTANLDSRLLPGTTPESMRLRLDQIVEDAGVEGVQVVARSSTPGGVSPWDDPFYEALARRAVEGMPEAVAGPALSPGFTDSIYLREMGVRAYGLMPVVVDEDGLRSMHGDNERVSTANLERGVRVLFSAVTDVCQGTDGHWEGEPTPLPRPTWDVPVLPDGTDAPAPDNGH
mgnify:CR=1 FL=1